MTEYRRTYQSGFTLIELMIGLLVGLIVLSAVIYIFLSTLKSSQDIRHSARLNREASTVIDQITGEVRRTGYFPVDKSLSGEESGYGESKSDLYVSSDCVLYSYYDDGVASAAARGFRSINGQILFGNISSLVSASCASLSSPLTDSDQVTSSFSASLTCLNTDTGVSASAENCTADSGTTDTFARGVLLDFTFEVPGTLWKLNTSEFVEVRNDLAP